MISNAKFTAGTGIDFYDRSLTSRKYALVGVACSIIFSCSCIIAGIVTFANHGVMGVTDMHIYNTVDVQYNQADLQKEIFALAFNLI
ncbi:hypothetical protein P692DRAFT_20647832, partial [Suillus brevipes Sb2]